MKRLFKKKFVIFVLILLVTGGYLGYKNFVKKEIETRYVTAAVEKGMLIVSVSGSGQISTSDQVDIKPKVSGEVAAIYIKQGDEVRTGKLVVKLDNTDYQKTIRNAELSLETAKLELEELLSPADELTLLQAENSLSKANQTKKEAEENIKQGYEDAFNVVTSAFFDLPAIITTARDVLYGYDIAKSEVTINDSNWNESVYQNSFHYIYRDTLQPFIRDAEQDYATARKDYDQNLKDYKNTSYYADHETINELLDETVKTTRSIAQAIKSEINLLDFVVDYFSEHDLRLYSGISTYQTNLKSYYSKINTLLQNLPSTQKSLRDNEQALIDAEIAVKENELSLADLKAGPDELDIKTKENAVQQKEDGLNTAKQELADCYIYAPFDGVIAETNIKKGDSVSAGTALATLITKQKIAEISLNEVDAAKVKVGQKATITFDALPDVTITGKVIEVDTVGAVSQGVVSYGVKIAFDIEEEQIKPGMSVTADIITDAKPDVLVLPNSAVKSQNNSHYVELVEAPEEMKQQLLNNKSGVTLPQAPKIQVVEIGLSNDTSTEIVSGLKEGDIVVTSTVSPGAAQTTQTQRTQQFQIPGMGGQMRVR